MASKKERIYVVVNDGNVEYATHSLSEAQDVCYNKTNQDVNDTVEECGRDVDDLTDEEMAEMAFLSGFNGGYHYVSKVYLDKDMDDSEFVTGEGVETGETDEFEVYEIRQKLQEA